MRRVGIVGVGQTAYTHGDPAVTAPELVFEAAQAALADAGMRRGDIDVVMSGSSDMVDGRAFAFVFGLEALGAWPPTHESHVEQDGAFAAWYAWLKILAGAADTALVAAWSKASEADVDRVSAAQLDPVVLAPLDVDATVSAGLQADAWLARTGADPAVLDDAVAAADAAGGRNPLVGTLPRPDGAEALATPLLRRHRGPVADGACAVVLAAADAWRSGAPPPAEVVGADHRADTGMLGLRDLSRVPAAAQAAAGARARAGWEARDAPDVAELSAPFAHQVPMLCAALGLPDDTVTDPSGGALAADPALATGLVRLAEAALQATGRAGGRQVEGARRALAHAASGHALQHNLVWLLEGPA